MTDEGLRARLIEVLREHRNCPWSHTKNESEFLGEHHVVDVLLTGPLGELVSALERVRALAEKMADENGQSWNSISAQRIRTALADTIANTTTSELADEEVFECPYCYAENVASALTCWACEEVL